MQYAVQRIIVAWVWWSFVASASPQNASTCILLPLSIKHVEHYTTQGIDAGFEAYSATHGVCTFHGRCCATDDSIVWSFRHSYTLVHNILRSARVVKQPTASCDHVIHDTVWDAHDVDDVVDDAALSIASYLALDIDCPTNDVAVHGWVRCGYTTCAQQHPSLGVTSCHTHTHRSSHCTHHHCARATVCCKQPVHPTISHPTQGSSAAVPPHPTQCVVVAPTATHAVYHSPRAPVAPCASHW